MKIGHNINSQNVQKNEVCRIYKRGCFLGGNVNTWFVRLMITAAVQLHSPPFGKKPENNFASSYGCLQVGSYLLYASELLKLFRQKVLIFVFG
jgi:hypothetical protein